MRLGFLGAGAVALEHARAAQALGHEPAAAAVRSGSSPRWAEFVALFPSARRVEDGRALLADPSLDAFVACLPWDETERWLEALIAVPKPVLIEKPAALSSAAVQRALSRAAGVAALKAVGYNRRFYEPVRRMKARLAEGGLKAVEVVGSEDVGRQVERHGAAIVPHLEAFSSHLLDLAQFLLGPLTVVKRYAAAAGAKDHGFQSRHALLETRAGIPVWLALNGGDPSPVGLRCRMDDGTTWHLSPLETLHVYDGFETLRAEEGRRIRRYVPRIRETVEADAHLKPGFVEQLRAFTRGEAGTLGTLQESADLLRLIEALRA
jgi:predicted dehydrogenase